MHIRTIEEDYEYRMKNIIKNLRESYEGLKDLDSEEMRDKLWDEYAKEFAHAILEDMDDFSGDELFGRMG